MELRAKVDSGEVLTEMVNIKMVGEVVRDSSETEKHVDKRRRLEGGLSWSITRSVRSEKDRTKRFKKVGDGQWVKVSTKVQKSINNIVVG